MDTGILELVESYRLDTEWYGDHVRHKRNPSDTNETENEDWTICEELGKGSFGVVHKQREERTGRLRAVKTVDRRKYPAPHYSTRESHIMAVLAKHPSLFVQFMGWYESDHWLYLAMEYIELGDLKKHLVTLAKPLSEDDVRRVAKQLLEGLKVMHEAGMAHRDIKPENIFIVALSPIRVKLGDFGISKQAHAQSGTYFRTEVCTEFYAAPEVLGYDLNSESSHYTNAVDIWSLGCVLYELLVRERLFSKRGQISGYYYRQYPFPVEKLEQLPSPIASSTISFIKAMVSPDPKERPTAAKALTDEWFAELDLLDAEFDRDGTRHTKDLTENDSEHWTVCEVLCAGPFGSCKKQREERTGRLRVVKSVRKRKCLAPPPSYPTGEPRVMTIAAKYSSLFVQFLWWSEDINSLYFAMECIELGDLGKRLGSHFSEETVQEIAKQLLSGLKVLNEASIAHGDIRPEKIFIVSLSPMHVKLGGFRITKPVQIDTDAIFYTAPEALGFRYDIRGLDFTSAVDIWSLGCVLYELLAGEGLFKTITSIIWYGAGNSTFPAERLRELPSPISKSGISFIRAMLAPDPKLRPSAAQAARDGWSGWFIKVRS